MTATEPAYTGYDACPGSHRDVYADSTDGAGVGTCPVCHRYVLTDPVGDGERFRRVERHRSSVRRSGHSHACLDSDGVLDGCVCGTDEQRAAGGWS